MRQQKQTQVQRSFFFLGRTFRKVLGRTFRKVRPKAFFGWRQFFCGHPFFDRNISFQPKNHNNMLAETFLPKHNFLTETSVSNRKNASVSTFVDRKKVLNRKITFNSRRNSVYKIAKTLNLNFVFQKNFGQNDFYIQLFTVVGVDTFKEAVYKITIEYRQLLRHFWLVTVNVT